MLVLTVLTPHLAGQHGKQHPACSAGVTKQVADSVQGVSGPVEVDIAHQDRSQRLHWKHAEGLLCGD